MTNAERERLTRLLGNTETKRWRVEFEVLGVEPEWFTKVYEIDAATRELATALAIRKLDEDYGREVRDAHFRGVTEVTR